MHSIHNTIYSGTSGLVLPIPKLSYPPEFQGASRLTYYASLFNSVEINSSFYKMPMVSTIRKWTESVPDNFQFTFKLPKTITHAKGLAFNPADIDLFMQTIDNIGSKKGCLLVQFPPGLKIEKIDEFKKLLIAIQQADPGHLWKMAVEFRNNSWYHEDVYYLLNQYKASMIIQDLPASATPITNSAASHIYIRFHGPNGSYRGSYTDDFLYNYAQDINTWNKAGKAVYVYFNNTMGDAVQNLQTLNGYNEQCRRQ